MVPDILRHLQTLKIKHHRPVKYRALFSPHPSIPEYSSHKIMPQAQSDFILRMPSTTDMGLNIKSNTMTRMSMTATLKCVSQKYEVSV
jgi:hypothetical protein